LQLKYSIGPTMAYVLDEVKKREIPYRQFNYGSLITLGHGSKRKKIRTAVADTTSGLGMEIAGDKEETKRILSEAYIPVPEGILVYTEAELRDRIDELNFPLVVKPLDGNNGRGVTTEINTIEHALFGFNIAKQISGTVIAEEYIKGDDYRFLVIDYKLVAVAKLTPAFIVGNGISTIAQLIAEENKNPERGSSAKHVLAFITTDEITMRILSEKHLGLNSVLPAGKVLVLKDTANVSSGGTATDVTEIIHPENKFLVERIARIFNLDICGIDIMATAIDVPITREIGAVIEVNAGPGLRMHSNPQKGKRRNVAAYVVDMLFPHVSFCNIPVVAVAGKDSKTITRLIAHLAKYAGYNSGCNTTDGIYIQDHLVYEGNATDFFSAQNLLFDPTIDFAVIECNDKNIVESGLGFDRCNVSILTDITTDYTSSNETHTQEEIIDIKSLVAKCTAIIGYTILNADNDLVYRIAEKMNCKVALFSLDKNNARITQHCIDGGMAAVVEDKNIVVYKGSEILSVIDIKDILGTEQVQNILPAVLTAVINEFKIDTIKEGLVSFFSPELALVE
jgi:cyanophycin synthetase